MSLDSQKNALFGKGPVSSAPSRSTNIAANTNISKGSGSTSSMSSAPAAKTGVSDEVRRIKINEGNEHRDNAMGYLATSMFKWSPDYLGAAPTFEQAANCYKIAGEPQLSFDMFLKASECHIKYGAPAAAALAYMKAADCARLTKNAANTAKAYVMAAGIFGSSGDLDRAADCYCRAASELTESDAVQANELFDKGLDLVCPIDIPESNLKFCKPTVMDLFRQYYKFLLGTKNYKAALQLSQRMIALYRSTESESSMCRTMLGVTLMQLQMGDVVGADRTFLQEHLNSTVYLNSNECRVAEEFITAFKEYDIELLDKVKTSDAMLFLDVDLQKLTRELSLFAGKNEVKKSIVPSVVIKKEVPIEVVEAKKPSEISAPSSKTLQDELNDLDINDGDLSNDNNYDSGDNDDETMGDSNVNIEEKKGEEKVGSNEEADDVEDNYDDDEIDLT